MTEDTSAARQAHQDALKNGYLQGYWQAVHDLEAGRPTKELRAHAEGALARWRNDPAKRFKEDRVELS